ncbi:hypothetical protein EV714DRAFT_240430 [Schizophyllum commune]
MSDWSLISLQLAPLPHPSGSTTTNAACRAVVDVHQCRASSTFQTASWYATGFALPSSPIPQTASLTYACPILDNRAPPLCSLPQYPKVTPTSLSPTHATTASSRRRRRCTASVMYAADEDAAVPVVSAPSTLVKYPGLTEVPPAPLALPSDDRGRNQLICDFLQTHAAGRTHGVSSSREATVKDPMHPSNLVEADLFNSRVHLDTGKGTALRSQRKGCYSVSFITSELPEAIGEGREKINLTRLALVPRFKRHRTSIIGGPRHHMPTLRISAPASWRALFSTTLEQRVRDLAPHETLHANRGANDVRGCGHEQDNENALSAPPPPFSSPPEPVRGVVESVRSV